MKTTSYISKPSALLVVLSLVLLSGCMAAKPAEDLWLKDKDLVLQSLQDAHMENVKLRERVGELDLRMVDLERVASKQSSKIKALEATPPQRVSAKKKKKNNKRKAISLKQRLDKLSAQLIIPAVPTVKVKLSAADEKNAYTAAYLALKSGRYEEASAGFTAVIRSHPEGEYTDQAYYWLGESYVAQRQFQDAIKAFSAVINKFPQGAKHAAGLLKLATTYQSLNQLTDARAALSRVIQEHPDSRTAERARVLLQSMSAGAAP
ncbi:MAG: tol-pal system protein YbgF [Mariprofundaceae bacterium]|nr:tol-pal system protein YbgF [Mariprofundaceae bacterium]